MTDVISIRSGQPADAPACAAILNDWIERTTWMPRIHPAEDVVRHYQQFVFAKRDIFVIGDPIEGYISLSDENYVTSLFCARRSAGLGKALLDHAKTLRDELFLWTFVANTGAQQFYLREGFVEKQRSDGDNEEGLPDILYHWEAR